MTLQYSNELAEMSVIGGLISDPVILGKLCSESRVSENHFASSQMSYLFRTITDMMSKAKPVDIITVADYVRSDPNNNVVLNGKKTITSIDTRIIDQCVDKYGSTSNPASHVELLCKYYMIRKMGCVFQNAVDTLPDNVEDPENLLTNVQAELLDLTSVRKEKDVFKRKTEAWKNAKLGKVMGIPLPWNGLNKQTGGPRRGHVCVLASRKGYGKSTLMANWIMHLGMNGIPCAALPMEDGAEVLYGRIAACFGGWNLWMADTGKYNELTIDRCESDLATVMKYPIVVDERRMSVKDIGMLATNLKIKKDIQCIFIDGFKDIQRGAKDDVAEENRISAGLCDIARRLDIAVVVVHHIKKRDSVKTGKDFDVDDIRGSGRIVDDARMVMMLQVEPYRLEVIRNNNGPTGYIEMNFLKEVSKFVEVSTTKD